MAILRAWSSSLHRFGEWTIELLPHLHLKGSGIFSGSLVIFTEMCGVTLAPGVVDVWPALCVGLLFPFLVLVLIATLLCDEFQAVHLVFQIELYPRVMPRLSWWAIHSWSLCLVSFLTLFLVRSANSFGYWSKLCNRSATSASGCSPLKSLDSLPTRWLVTRPLSKSLRDIWL